MAKYAPNSPMPEDEWIDKEYIEVRRNEHGQLGGFARKFIPADTLLDVLAGADLYAVPVTDEGRLDLDKFGLVYHEFLQICRHKDTIICLGDRENNDLTGSDYVNHSCRPNCVIKSSLQLRSLTDIEEGAELFYDYRKAWFVPEGIECWCDTDEKCII